MPCNFLSYSLLIIVFLFLFLVRFFFFFLLLLFFFFKVGELMAHAFEISRAVPAKVASQLASDARAWPTTGLGISALPKVSQR